MKKLLCIVLSISVFLTTLAACAPAFAASYETTLKNKGFTDSYIDSLIELHKKYPNWTFEVFNTGLDWSEAVAGERSKHSNQIVEKNSSTSEIFYCNCPSCKPNGSYKYIYGSCVCASQWAVEYYMDPRNWLDEKHIFQFQSNAYNSSDTQDGVEAIIGSTWMADSVIKYKNTAGTEVTYKLSGKSVKYSKAIMNAAKSSGMSAYYLASRIVKEVGAKNPTAAGVCGTKSPFNGIYNYYSIGASSGAMSGLEWAAGYLRTNKATTLYSEYADGKVAGTTTALKDKQYATYITAVGDYYKVRLYNESNYSAGKVGYVLKSDMRTTYFNYERPWITPYRSIVGGADYIAAKFGKYQYTTYLEKFNVNKNSGSLYSHEYMQNVDAVSTESVSTYKAYKEAGVLSAKRVFYIPVFSNMPGDTSQQDEQVVTKPTRPALKARTTNSISVRWSAVTGASKYELFIKNATKNTTFTKTVTTNSAVLKNLTAGNKYRMKVRAYRAGSWTEYSGVRTVKALPMRVKIKSASSPSSGKIYTYWDKINGASGYVIKYARDSKFKKTVATKTLAATQTSYTGKNFSKGVTYYVKVRAYTVVNGKKYYGKWSKVKAVKSK